jgi:hypothetical protein
MAATRKDHSGGFGLNRLTGPLRRALLDDEHALALNGHRHGDVRGIRHLTVSAPPGLGLCIVATSHIAPLSYRQALAIRVPRPAALREVRAAKKWAVAS